MVVLTEITEESSTSSSAHDSRYDVFISFRGVDTRNSFTDHLYNTLKNANICTFLDDAEIHTGDELGPELVSAIKTSRASIIVVSKNYASSTWCLDELVLILDQRRTTEHIVIPIFYHVVPTDVRKQQNSFGEAMAEHKQKMEAETNAEKKSQRAQKMEKWEKALAEVADLKGKDANNSTPETKLIKGIVEDISSRLELHKRSKIPKIIGMDSSIRKITSFLKDGSSHVTKILTIYGMAGIGKTHLADYIFKLHYLDFERSSFVDNIERKSTEPNGLIDIQKQLLKDIRYESWMDISNTDVGTCKIEGLLCRKRTLLVLDGINKFEQLDVLIGTNNLHPGSRILITSKSEFLTEKCGLFQTKVLPLMHTKLLLEGLGENESLQLLSWHAFGHDEPKEDDKKDSIKIIRYCRGHPLALKVLGSSLHNDGVTLKDIGESLGEEMNTDIQKVLKISFDSLPYEKDKELFKHIACFFVREDRKFTEDILKACGICKSSGVNILINRCLLTVGSSNKLEMHQLLQDMGRDIVRQEHSDKPWKRSLLWHYKECLDVLQNRKGTTKIQGFVLDMKTETSCSSSSTNKRKYENAFSVHPQKGGFETRAFSKMCNLRLLRLNYVQLEGSYGNFPKGLVWLCMHGLPLRCIPSHIQMGNMVALDMSNSNLQKLWEEPKLLRSLKFLNLSSCHELVSVGHFSWFPALERLILARCKRLNELCDSIGNHCHQLEVLDLSGCIELKELPQTIGKLKNLTELSINGCSNLSKFPADMTGMESLKVLMANNVVSSSAIVKAIPRSLKISAISLPISLVRLSLKNNNLSNESFPKDFSSLSMLKILNLDENPIVSLPDCVRSLSRLERLTLVQCRSLKRVLCAPNTLKHLNIYNCYALEEVTFHPEKSAPPDVHYFDASTVTEIQDKFRLEALSEVDEEILHSLGWNNIEYLRYYKVSMADSDGCYQCPGVTIPRQMLYEHGIFSTYLEGQEVPKWFTHRGKGSSFTLQSSPKNRRICGLNICIVSTISSPEEIGPSRIQIRNLTKNCSWTYQPITFVHPEDYEFENGGEAIVWLSHWMFQNKEFEDGDEVSIRVSAKFYFLNDGDNLVFYAPNRPDYANVREYGISLVYEDGNKREDPLAYYKSWKHIIGGDLSAAEVSSGHYRLLHWPGFIDI